ncbi:MAG: hypothetical protein QOJ57_1830 [Thermoleophilaceae bacterium]|jgi:cyanobactin maturation PatA/PatG family protease|nr:hypothetical protein [Thermoleophilaceae bacterium]
MADVATIPGLAELWGRTVGDDRIRIAVVDGAVDMAHESFSGADLVVAKGIWPREENYEGPKARHGTYVSSVIFGQHAGPVPGVAPGCSGIAIAAFSDRRRTSQLDIARAIELAVESGAHVINISGGELTSSGEAEDFLARAVRLCHERNVLVVAAAGNDGCYCDALPAALPTALAVGALDEAGDPLECSNWGPAYQDHGILAPGENILAAVPGGTVTRCSGTSFATPIVSGVAGLLLSLQVQSGEEPDPSAVRAALLASVDPCELEDPQACKRFLSGKLNVRRAMSAVTSDMTPTDGVQVHGCACGGTTAEDGIEEPVTATATSEEEPVATAAAGGAWEPPVPATGPPSRVAEPPQSEVALAQAPDSAAPYVYALGTIGYDFGTEARRDSFKQLMAEVEIPDPGGGQPIFVPPNPYDARQMVAHLQAFPAEAQALIWTLNLELTPIYAIEPVGPYAADIYATLVRLLAGETAPEDAPDYVERVSVPGLLTDRHIKLFSGQPVPVVASEQARGMYGWQVNNLSQAATAAAEGGAPDPVVAAALAEFLQRIYYDLRNLGSSSSERALNFAATNAFQAALTFVQALAAGMALDTITVEKSPFCRMDSDCWDVKLVFFNPDNTNTARKVYRFTIDVSDILPVTLGDVRSWSEAG